MVPTGSIHRPAERLFWISIKSELNVNTLITTAGTPVIHQVRPVCFSHTVIPANDSAAADSEHVIRLKGPYDIAVNRQADGTFGLTTDWWDGHVAKEVGPSYGRLLQLYAVHKATAEARKRGHSVQRKAAVNGAIKLVIGGAW